MARVSETTLLVRYLFDEPALLQQHLQLDADGGGSLFLPEPSLERAVGTRTVVEVVFRAPSHQCVLHGVVSARAPEGGLWIEVPAAGSAGSILRSGQAPQTLRRESRRIAADLLAEVRPRAALPYLCRVTDLGRGGARLGAGTHSVGLADQRVEVTLLGPEPGLPNVELQARFSRVKSREAGLQFVAPDDSKSLTRLLSALELRWSDATRIVHGQTCGCVKGEPPRDFPLAARPSSPLYR